MAKKADGLGRFRYDDDDDDDEDDEDDESDDDDEGDEDNRNDEYCFRSEEGRSTPPRLGSRPGRDAAVVATSRAETVVAETIRGAVNAGVEIEGMTVVGEAQEPREEATTTPTTERRNARPALKSPDPSSSESRA